MKLLDSFGVSVAGVALKLTFPELIEIVPTDRIPSHRRPGDAAYSQVVLRVGKPSTSGPKPTVMLACGMHGRELMNTQAGILLTHGLLHHYTENRDWHLTAQRYSTAMGWPTYSSSGGSAPIPRAQIRRLVEDIDFLIVLNTNPNGRDEAFEQAGARPEQRTGCRLEWFNRFLPALPVGSPRGRQNQRSISNAEMIASGLATGRSCAIGDRSVPDGVDLNRNFPFLHGIEGRGTSRCPSTVFCGPSPASEVETQNLVQLLDDNPTIRCFIDVHSYDVDGGNGWIIHPWGHSVSQSTNPNESTFRRNPYNTTHWLPSTGPTPEHNEYLPPADRARYTRIADDAIAATRVAGLEYTKVIDGDLIDGLYPVTGASSEYAYARQFLGINPDNPCDGWALETGRRWWEEPGSVQYANHINGAITCLTAIASGYLP